MISIIVTNGIFVITKWKEKDTYLFMVEGSREPGNHATIWMSIEELKTLSNKINELLINQ